MTDFTERVRSKVTLHIYHPNGSAEKIIIFRSPDFPYNLFMKGKAKVIILTIYNIKEKSLLIFNFYYEYLLQFPMNKFV